MKLLLKRLKPSAYKNIVKSFISASVVRGSRDVFQLTMAFSRVKSGYKQNGVSSLTTAELRAMGNIACGISAPDIALIDEAVFWYDNPLTHSSSSRLL